MPEEILIIVVVSIVAGTLMSLVKMILQYRENRHSVGGSRESSSLTTSELERMMKRAVEEATEPIQRKLEDLELAASRPPPSLSEARPDLLLDVDVDEHEKSETRSAAVRNRT